MAVLEIKKLDYCYKEELILRDFSLSVERGEIYGLVGNPRSGKTTIINLILGLLGAPQNAVFLFGNDYSKRRREIPAITGSVVDIPYYHNFLTVWENFKFFDVKYHFGEERIIEVLKLIGLASVRNKKVRALRSEQQKRLSIGLAMFHNPDFLVLDDLFRGLRKQSKTQLYKLLLKLQKIGKTILITNRGLTEIESICSTDWNIRIGQSCHRRICKRGKEIYAETISGKKQRTDKPRSYESIQIERKFELLNLLKSYRG